VKNDKNGSFKEIIWELNKRHYEKNRLVTRRQIEDAVISLAAVTPKRDSSDETT
jgi:hypothetical protein